MSAPMRRECEMIDRVHGICEAALLLFAHAANLLAYDHLREIQVHDECAVCKKT